jgi:hypothetical protein
MFAVWSLCAPDMTSSEVDDEVSSIVSARAAAVGVLLPAPAIVSTRSLEIVPFSFVL